MHRFTCVFFEVGAGQLHGFAVGFLAFANIERERTTDDHGQLKLTDLIAFGQIWVKIIFACEHAHGCDLRINRQAKHDGFFNRGFVQHGQHPWECQIDRARLRVWLRAIRGGRA